MYLIGHTDPTLTMRVYQQVIDMGRAASKRSRGSSDARSTRPSHCFPAGGFWQPIGNRPTKKASQPGAWSELEGTETP
jgi:hypothetical protein